MIKTDSQLRAETAVKTAIINTRNLMSAFWRKMLIEHLNGSKTSAGYYPQYWALEELEKALKRASWEETTHPLVGNECKLFVARISGLSGYIKIRDMPENLVFVIERCKQNPNFASLLVRECDVFRHEEALTYLTMGLLHSEGMEYIKEIQIGEPIVSMVAVPESVASGTPMTKSRALALGFEWARVEKW